jgi:hypothetical protein
MCVHFAVTDRKVFAAVDAQTLDLRFAHTQPGVSLEKSLSTVWWKAACRRIVCHLFCTALGEKLACVGVLALLKLGASFIIPASLIVRTRGWRSTRLDKKVYRVTKADSVAVKRKNILSCLLQIIDPPEKELVNTNAHHSKIVFNTNTETSSYLHVNGFHRFYKNELQICTSVKVCIFYEEQ